MRIAGHSVGALLLALAALACGGEDSTAPKPPAPVVGKVTVSNLFFKSDRNATSNPAVDTVTVGTEVTWRWINTGSAPHNVQSNGPPSFASSALLTGEGSQVKITFDTPGFYQYACSVHAGMTGRIIVQ
jgi:plastocyanin